MAVHAGGGPPGAIAYNSRLIFPTCPIPVSALASLCQPCAARWQQLVTPGWLADLGAGQAPDGAPRQHWQLYEVGSGAAQVFRAGHLPGAGYLDTNWLEQAPSWNKVADAALLRLLLENGITHDCCVVLYGRNMLAAARVAHLLLYAGVRDVRLLDGGFRAWQAAGLPLQRGAPRTALPVASFGRAFPAHPEYLIDTAGAKRVLQAEDGALVSIRSHAEYCGLTSGYSYIAARGEIPGARWGRAGADGDINSMSAFQHADGRMKPAHEISHFWLAAGIHPARHNAFYCGTGWRASLAFFYAWVMGWERISVYDGGWHEWSADPANPIAHNELANPLAQNPQSPTLAAV